MPWRRPLTLALLIALVVVQAELWVGKVGMLRMLQLRSQVESVQAANAAARLANERLQAEVSDLKSGLEMVEEKARYELGMVKPNEILVQYDSHASAPGATSSVPARP